MATFKSSIPKNYTSSATEEKKPTTSSSTKAIFKSTIDEERTKRETPSDFYFNGSHYVQDNTGNYVKFEPYKQQSERDTQSIIDTGHKTFGTDMSNALIGGGTMWGANQLSTLATAGLAYQGIKNKDNNYQAEHGSTLWKMLQASSAKNREASSLMEDSKEGRGKVGQLAMDVSSQAVMNGIDAALKSIPGIGEVLGTVSFASRAFGGTAQQAREEGKSIGTQVLTGGVSAAIEAVTEAMWGYGGVRSYTGKMVENSGILGNLTNLAESTLAKYIGPVASKLAMSFGTEATEEMLADVLNPAFSAIIENFTKDSKLFSDYEAEEWQGLGNMLYDGLVGGISGIGGGLYESVGAIDTYNKTGKNNALYSAAIRQQYQANRADAKLASQAAGALRRQSLSDAIETLFNRKTGKTIIERAAEAGNTLVSRKQAFSLMNNADEDLSKIYRDIAKNFAENNVANEVINKKVLENAVYNYLSTGEFASELNSADNAKEQIQALAKHIMAEYVSTLEQNAKSKKDKVKQTFYGSILARLMNENLAEEQTETATEEEVTEATPFRTSMDEIEADRLAREAETPNEQIRYTDRYENEELPYIVHDDVDVNEGQVFQPARETLNTESNTSNTSNALDALETETPNAESVESSTMANDVEPAPTVMSNAEQKKVDKLFAGTQKSVIIEGTNHGYEVRQEIKARAEAEGKEVVEKQRKDGRTQITLTDRVSEEDANLEEQHAKIADIAEQLGLNLDEEEPKTTIKRFASPLNTTKNRNNRALSLALKYVLADRARELTGSELHEALNYTLKKAGIKRYSKYLLDNISDYIFGNFEKQTSQEVFDSTREKGEDYLGFPDVSHVTSPDDARRQVAVRDDAYSQDVEEETYTPNDLANALFNLIKEYDRRRFDINSYIQLSRDGKTKFNVGDEETYSPDFSSEAEYADDDVTGEIINTLHESYGEGFPTEEAVNLRSSLMSGFAPSDKYGVGDLSVEERLAILREAFPDEDFSISHYNKNEIVDDTTVGEDEEAQRDERNWNRRNLKDEVANQAKSAFGYIPVDADKKSRIGTNRKGEPVYASGFVDVNKTSVKDKLANQNALQLRQEVKQNVDNIQKQLDNINKTIKNIQTVYNATGDSAFRERLSKQISDLQASAQQLSDEIKAEQDRLTQELGRSANWNSVIRGEKQNVVNETWIDRLSETQLDNIFGDGYNGYYNNHKLTADETAYGKKLLDSYKRRTRNPFITESPKRNAGLGTNTGNEIQIGERNERRTESYLANSSTGERLQASERTGERVGKRPGIQKATGADSFNLGGRSRGRIAYSDSAFLSLYDDSVAGQGKKIGSVLSAKETQGDKFDNVRKLYAQRPNVSKVIFIDGHVYDSLSDTLNDGVVVTFPDGKSVVVVSTSSGEIEKVSTHEDTHLAIDQNRAASNPLFDENNLRRTVESILGKDFVHVRYAVVTNGKYQAGDIRTVLDEIVCNINAGLDCYGIRFSDYKEALSKTPIYQYLTSTVNATAEAGVRRFASDEEVPTLAEYNERIEEERREDRRNRLAREAAGEERYQAARQADKATPTLDDFNKAQAEQPVASKKMSPSEAWELAGRTFGSQHKRVTRAVRNFQKINSPFAKDLDGKKYGSKGKLITDKLGDMLQSLADVNDGYGTIKDVADLYNGWRDDGVMKDYWSVEVADRFRTILSDADDADWTFSQQQQREVAQALEEAVNAMKANIVNTDASTMRLSSLAAEAVTNKLNLKKDGLVSKAIQKYLRYQFTTDTALKLFGGFKGDGEFYKLSSDIKNAVAKRMVKYVEAYSYFDDVKKMEGFDKFATDTKKYKLDPHSEFLQKNNPMGDHEFTLQQIVTIKRLYDTLYETFKHSDAKINERVQGFVVRDADGNSFTVDLTSEGETAERQAMDRTNQIYSVLHACEEILDQDTPEAKAAKAYSKACDKMFAALGKDVSAVKKQLTGNGLSLIGDNYTPVLWANEDGSPADFNFSYDDERLRPPRFLYKRTGNAGYLVVSPISYIVDKYIQSASDYVGMGQMRDTLSRLNNGTAFSDETKSLASTLGENFGKDAGAWFNEYVKDLTTYQENDSIFAELRRRLQRGALIGSPSVMMKQTSSYWSAMGLLSPEALTMAYRWKVGMKAADYSELNQKLKYRKISNNIDPTLTEIIRSAEKYGAASKSKVLQLFTNGISAQDQKTVDNLYLATEYDTILNNMDKGAEYFTSEQYVADVDAKFTEVMMRSQPMFDTELRAEYARTDNEFIKMLSMFRTQQTQNMNLIISALGEYKASKGTSAQNDKAQVLRQTVGGQISAAVSLGLLSIAADFMLHGLKKYRGDGDDEDEEPGDGRIEVQRILTRLGINSVEAQAGTFWGGDYLAKWLIDKMSGGETNEFYGINMGPITTLQNIIQNLEYVAKSPTPSNIKNTVTYISQATGFPLNNIYRMVNSAIMYTADATGQNPDNFDDITKMWSQDVKMSEKNSAARNLLVDSGMSRKEAKSFINDVDENRNGLSQQELKDYYVEHPEDAEKISILWDSMGFSKAWAKTKPSLDKKVAYNSNPLFAEIDVDESESVSKQELTDYALEHPDQYAELKEAYDQLGFKGSLKSAIKSAEQTQRKEEAEALFEEGDYNALFDSISHIKSGKNFLTNLIREETDDYDTPTNNLLFNFLTEANLDDKTMDTAVESIGADKYVSQYRTLRSSGLSPKDAIARIDDFDVNDNGSITQAELAEYYKAHKNEENIIAEFWAACGWSTSWAKYKKSKKIT